MSYKFYFSPYFLFFFSFLLKNRCHPTVFKIFLFLPKGVTHTILIRAKVESNPQIQWKIFHEKLEDGVLKRPLKTPIFPNSTPYALNEKPPNEKGPDLQRSSQAQT